MSEDAVEIKIPLGLLLAGLAIIAGYALLIAGGRNWRWPW